MRVDLSMVDRLGLARLPRELTRVKEYTDAVLNAAVERGQLHPAALTEVDSVTRGRVRQFHETIARLLEHHLNANPEFTYSLDLKRSNRTIDPIEDFLLNVKAGHCQRYATALVMMLRSQGITTQLVLGFRGCESRGDGWYDVYSSNAHAWVEVLVPAPEAQLPPLLDRNSGQVRTGPWLPMRWVTLDPTPGGGDDSDPGTVGFLEHAKQRWESLFRLFVLTYNADSRDEALQTIQRWLTDDGGVYWLGAGVGGVLGLVWLRRRWKHWRRHHTHAWPVFLQPLLTAFAQRGLTPHRGQTLREYVIHALTTLQLDTTASSVPLRAVNAYYADSYGAHTLTPEQQQQLTTDVQAFARSFA
jgi:hypothetical protein